MQNNNKGRNPDEIYTKISFQNAAGTYFQWFNQSNLATAVRKLLEAKPCNTINFKLKTSLEAVRITHDQVR